ncbi:MAG: hypothetical protein M1837_002226 [Sclerophora amabilis]|nr:MAG: hypothetical protein M1837_002226 [Sclerophora amabilis]
MRGKRAKQYRKLMQQHGISFGFREPYQVLLDAELLKATAAFKMDVVGGLERTLQGKIKPMITQCSMRHLYTSDPRVPQLVELAQTFERRRCDHHTLDKPLSTIDCLSSVVDPKNSKTNKHRYVVASQAAEVRAFMRRIPGVPLVYVNRSVMIMEPMASATEQKRDDEEREKFETGLKGKRQASSASKRKRVGSSVEDRDTNGDASSGGEAEISKKKKKKAKGPNPLSVKKATIIPSANGPKGAQSEQRVIDGKPHIHPRGEDQCRSSAEGSKGDLPERAKTRKRKRKHTSSMVLERPVPRTNTLDIEV